MVKCEKVDIIRDELSNRCAGRNIILTVCNGLALLTSFLGVAMSLFDQNVDLFRQNRVVTYVLTFILPLLGAIFAANQFLSVLSYAGLILVFIAVFIPMLMIHNIRKSTQTVSSSGYQVAGGSFAMLMSLLFGCFLIGAQLI